MENVPLGKGEPKSKKPPHHCSKARVIRWAKNIYQMLTIKVLGFGK